MVKKNNEFYYQKTTFHIIFSARTGRSKINHSLSRHLLEDCAKGVKMVVHSVARATCCLLLLTFGRNPIAQTLPQPSAHKQVNELTAIHTEPTLHNLTHSINELQQIPSWRAHNITQPYNQLSVLYTNAFPAQQELNMLLETSALYSQSKALLPGIKSQQRAKTKIATELNGHTNKLTDIVRGSLVCDNISDLIKTYDFIAQHASVLEVKNRFSAPAASGYRDIKMLVRLNNSGLVAEVQLHLEAIAEIKNGEEHDIYEMIQSIERLAIAQDRELNDIEKMKIKRLQQQSKALYAQAWKSYTTPLSLVS